MAAVLERAQLTALSGADGRELPAAERKPLPVGFNPEKLELTLSTAIEQNRERTPEQPPQLVKESTAKLALELVFDTTTDGRDVRTLTHQVAEMMQPRPDVSGTEGAAERKVPSIVLFEWGSFVFKGYIDSYRETIDFFAPEGVPLRSTLSLSLSEQGDAFPAPRPAGTAPDVGRGASVLGLGGGQSIDALARRLGDPAAAGFIAMANGIESRRLPGVAAVAVAGVGGGGRGPVAFASAGAGVGAGLGLGAGGGIGAGGAAGGTLRAFAGLKAAPPAAAPRLSVERALGGPPSAGIGLQAGFGVGGRAAGGFAAGAGIGARAGFGAGAGITAEVGAEAGAASLIFEEG